MIDLEKLKREAESTDGDRAVVSRTWMAQVLAEISAGRAAAVELAALRATQGQVFGLKPGDRI